LKIITTNIGLKGSFFRRKKFGRMRSELGERRMNPLSPVSFVSSYEVLETCVRRVGKKQITSRTKFLKIKRIKANKKIRAKKEL